MRGMNEREKSETTDGVPLCVIVRARVGVCCNLGSAFQTLNSLHPISLMKVTH